jgi:hypothetical protein
LLLDCFVLAADVRELDMRASPYDLRDAGYEPVAIETPEGKAQYVTAQRGFARRGAELRSRLLGVCDAVLAHVRRSELTVSGEPGPGTTSSADHRGATTAQTPSRG